MFGRKKPDKSRDSSKPKETTAFAPRRTPIRPFWALVCVALAVLAILACAGYTPGQHVYFQWLAVSAGGTPPPGNPVGTMGATYAALSNWLMGAASLIGVPAFALWLSFLFISRRGHAVRVMKFLLMALALLVASGLADMLFEWSGQGPSDYFPKGFGGVIGDLLYARMLSQPLGHMGSGIVLGLVYVTCIMFIFTDEPAQSFEWWLQAWATWRKDRAEAKRLQAIEAEKQKAARIAALAAAKAAQADAAKTPPGTAAKTPVAAKPAEEAAPKAHGTFKVGENLTLFSDGIQEGEHTLTSDQVTKWGAGAAKTKGARAKSEGVKNYRRGKSGKGLATPAAEKRRLYFPHAQFARAATGTADRHRGVP